MLQYFFISIIVVILLKELYDTYNEKPKINKTSIKIQEAPEPSYKSKSDYIFNSVNKPSETLQEIIQEEHYDKDNIWSRIIVDKSSDYPYLYHIKVAIPSLNDLQNWIKIIPNLNFSPHTGELIIPSKDEGSALAVANLIIANLNNNISMSDIINKQLLQISIAKAQSHDLVRTKLKEQIKTNLNIKASSDASKVPNFEMDLANKNNMVNKANLMFNKSTIEEKITHPIRDVEGFDGNDYSYL
jgi:hypothetical protein